MALPSRVGGAATHTVGYFEHDHRSLADWLASSLGAGWVTSNPGWRSLGDVLTALTPAPDLTRHACVAIDGWTLLMNNSPLGTDVGVLPSLAARELKCRAIRAVRVDDDESGYPARILEVFGPDGEPPLAYERSIAAVNDGGRWMFETSGEAFEFEDETAYRRRLKSSRFTGDMLRAYLVALGVPVDAEPSWSTAILIELAADDKLRRFSPRWPACGS